VIAFGLPFGLPSDCLRWASLTQDAPARTPLKQRKKSALEAERRQLAEARAAEEEAMRRRREDDDARDATRAAERAAKKEALRKGH
jgi:hypothetical protein